ncbi:tRNAHis guanylyltransferase [Aureobasidium pullulans]|uniref:tRNA(His) guanylyltransferase n=1 Tax=Aureobasidium pullulans TaxID=5580 RepID=A0A4S8Y134_AURPU|nr:tRNAHis guanylyltransferase [Aureobasidium pullulans]THY12796.1 tRNAHis guanylyltransferase [Aureobasidium pullulans]
MANSEFEYVRKFEEWDALAPSNWIVVRIDGRGFSKFSKRQNFAKPNDRRAIDLMNAAAIEVVKQFTDIVIAYGQSDEYSFVLHEDCQLFERRAAKLATSISTAFSVEYCMQWGKYFEGQELERPFPTFDGRCVLYPKKSILRDYLSWRQADCHVNNLYNTTFWNMVKGNPDTDTPAMTTTEAELALKGTFSADKNEILFKRFNINYNAEGEIWKKGSVYEDKPSATESTPEQAFGKSSDEKKKPLSKTQMEKERKRKQKARVVVEHVDIIKDKFWQENPWILG